MIYLIERVCCEEPKINTLFDSPISIFHVTFKHLKMQHIFICFNIILKFEPSVCLYKWQSF